MDAHNSRTAMRLLIQISKEHRDRAYQVLVKQLWNQEEMGRVTWELRPKGRQKNRL
jgi:hypothetical protein